MIVYLMRHGIAEDASPSGRDADRPLSEQGTLRTALVAKGLERLEISFARIVSSPYVRARQTAEIVARIIGHDAEILLDDRLTPFGTIEGLGAVISENNDAEHLLLTGHEPSMSHFISGLTSDGHLRIDVKKASVTAIELNRFRPQPAGTLLWSLPPKVIEGLGR